ncbi:MAG: bifunctional adenosylcobinamide kinase/adenosylcobinamide-phosphate guanylyltransferase, partial [Oscillospiraceae bacterium]|nr:bifunctional adenosylcobinamide kinase/adenosylcobinamide-phosphate guanylyltransferase [Oscillospiraceae bacterium]
MLELITGGSGSGKSEYAENRAMELCGDSEPLIYLAAMKPYGEGAQKRIERHRKLREGKGFKTIEKYIDYADVELPENATVLLECMSNLLANEMFDAGGDFIRRIITGIEHIADSSKNLVIVTNDIFSDGVS